MTAEFDSNRIDLAMEGDFRLGESLVRPSTRQFESKGEPQTLQPRIMQVLVALARRQGQVVSRDELVATCWEGRSVGDDAINRCIHEIRKLGEASQAFEIETIPRVGYRLFAQEAAEASPPAGVQAAPSGQASADRPSRPGPMARPVMLLAAAVGVAALAVLAWIAFPKSTPPSDRVAFFGFTASSDDPALKDIAMRATDEAYIDLSIRRIDTVARSEAIIPAGKTRLDRAADLKARFALSGEVRRDGDNNVITIRVENVATRATFVEFTTTRPVTMPVPIAFSAADRATNVTSCIVTTGFTDDAAPSDPEALAVVASGCGAIANAQSRNVPFYRELIEKKIGGPSADASLAAWLAYTLEFSPPAARAGMISEAEQALARASRNAPDSPTVPIARARLAIATGAPPAKWIPEVEAAMRRQPQAHENYAYAVLSWSATQAMWATGRLKDALIYAKAGRDADPLSGLNRSQYVTLLAATGAINQDFVSWDVQALKINRERPDGIIWDYTLVQMILSGRGDVEAMLNAPPWPDAEPYIVNCYRDLWPATRLTAAADRRAAMKKAEPCLLRWDGRQVIIEMASVLGDLDMAFAQLATPELANHSAFNYYAGWFMPHATALRADPRFLPLMEKLGYVDYWKQTKTKPDVCSTPEERDIPLCKALM